MASRMQAIRRAQQIDRHDEEQRRERRRAEVFTAYSPIKTGRDFARRLRQIESSLRDLD